MPWPSQALIFPHSLPLPPLSLWGFFSLLDGAEAEPQTNFSHSCNEAWRAQFVSLRGNRIHSSVPQKTPFFQTERELFVWWQLQLSSRSSCDSFKSMSMMACCCAHYGASYVVIHGDVGNQQSNCTLSAFKRSFQMIPNYLCKAHERACLSQLCWRNAPQYWSHSMVLKRKQSRACAFIVFIEKATVDHLAVNSLLTGHLSTWWHTKETGTPVPRWELHCQSHTYITFLHGHNVKTCCTCFPSHPEVKSQMCHSNRLSVTVYRPIKSTPALSCDPPFSICFHSPWGYDFALISQWTSLCHITVFNG